MKVIMNSVILPNKIKRLEKFPGVLFYAIWLMILIRFQLFVGFLQRALQ